MDPYLTRFREKLRKYDGSLVRVASVREPRAKEYMARLSAEGAVEKVDWGWYYVPARRPPESPLEFLAQDCNFKVVTGQTAASYWNADFIHREGVTVTVEDRSYARALEAFFRKREWQIDVDVRKDARKVPAKKVRGLNVEEPGRTVVDCMKRWAFVDAVAVLASNRSVPFEKLAEETAWSRIPRTAVRIGQALEYVGYHLFHQGREAQIRDPFVRGELDEAVAKVREFE